MKIRIPDDVKAIAKIFKVHGFQCYAVGGAVRDSLLNKQPVDWDLATDALPENVIAMFKAVIPTGIQHGTVTIRWKGKSFETTTFRIESDYSDSRHPDTVSYTDSLQLDLARRDFTINSLAADPFNGTVIDYFNGIEDLRSRIVRAVGTPLERFNEDVLRTLRAIRFAGVLQFTIEPETFHAISLALEKFPLVSAERVRDEFSKLLLAPRPSYPLQLLDESGLLEHILPELKACKSVAQGNMHRFDVFNHLLASCDASPSDLVTRLSALLHDIAKPLCRNNNEQTLTFYGHDIESAHMTKQILTRLKYPNAVIETVCALIANHMIAYDDSWTDGAVRRFIRRVGTENLDRFFSLKIADASGMTGLPPDFRTVQALYERVQAIIQNQHALSLKDLSINGNDLQKIGYQKGPILGKVLQELLETVLDDPSLNTKDRLLYIAERLKNKYLQP
ncbi:MAG TPA: CCA tRNA nucleotidyltransferase [Spirochaetia bacterium]|nr:CCA tRNA nucleotidyltransferase [Spirochaetales bacterium]HRS65183.1 CCA tRNA nucleotidyltransferase [Spirochaetia bacterium]HOT60488.1 CCA tRNA nucleotidyltransferase [Spirochaetales bacterium]HPD80295.1 CCA tRNA nucleotidyltransferase [Spirochaetales bacterium]HQK35225.1 CCA tRNA nucleotidyltransferase [Spirochaetales bacterium]